MAQGRGIAYAAALLLAILGLQLLSCHQLASAATYTVGDSMGWDIGVDYTSWAAGHTFKVGDILFFPYMEELHDVVVVNKAGYDACSASKPIATFSAGNTNVTLGATGAHYYLCSVIGHCAAGMKLAVTVTASGAAAPTTAPTPSKTPSSPSKTPSSPPIKAPSTAPSSTPPPSSAPPSSSPAPAPSPEAPAPTPASAPTPSSPAPTPAVAPSASSPNAPGSSPSSPGAPTPSPSPPNAAPSLLAAASIAPLLALWAALFV